MPLSLLIPDNSRRLPGPKAGLRQAGPKARVDRGTSRAPRAASPATPGRVSARSASPPGLLPPPRLRDGGRRGGRDPPPELTDAPSPPMARALGPGGLGKGRGSRRNLSCPLVPGKVLRPAPSFRAAYFGCRHVGEEKSPLRPLSKCPRRRPLPRLSHRRRIETRAAAPAARGPWPSVCS